MPTNIRNMMMMMTNKHTRSLRFYSFTKLHWTSFFFASVSLVSFALVEMLITSWWLFHLFSCVKFHKYSSNFFFISLHFLYAASLLINENFVFLFFSCMSFSLLSLFRYVTTLYFSVWEKCKRKIEIRVYTIEMCIIEMKEKKNSQHQTFTGFIFAQFSRIKSKK